VIVSVKGLKYYHIIRRLVLCLCAVAPKISAFAPLIHNFLMSCLSMQSPCISVHLMIHKVVVLCSRAHIWSASCQLPLCLVLWNGFGSDCCAIPDTQMLPLNIAGQTTRYRRSSTLLWIHFTSSCTSHCLLTALYTTTAVPQIVLVYVFWPQISDQKLVLFFVAFYRITILSILSKGKAIPLQAWTGPDGPRSLRLPYFKTFGTWRW